MSKQMRGVPFHFETEELYSPIFRESVRQTTLIVPGGGCRYWLKAKGEVCPFCVFPLTTRAVVLGEGMAKHFEAWTLDAQTYVDMFDAMIGASATIERLAIFNGGGFFHEKELPEAFQDHVARWYGQSETCRELFVESRPEEVTEARLRRFSRLAAGKPITVGIGFETRDAGLRNKVLKKGISQARFEEALATLRSHGARSFAYVFLKPPGLTEGAAYEDVLTTLDYLREAGVDQMALSSAFVPEGTHLETLYRQGAFRPPWLWTIVEIAWHAHPRAYPLSIGGLGDYPPPIAIASNCERCSKTVHAAIDAYRRTGDLHAFNGLDCECRRDWRADFIDSRGGLDSIRAIKT